MYPYSVNSLLRTDSCSFGRQDYPFFTRSRTTARVPRAGWFFLMVKKVRNDRWFDAVEIRRTLLRENQMRKTQKMDQAALMNIKRHPLRLTLSGSEKKLQTFLDTLCSLQNGLLWCVFFLSEGRIFCSMCHFSTNTTRVLPGGNLAFKTWAIYNTATNHSLRCFWSFVFFWKSDPEVLNFYRQASFRTKVFQPLIKVAIPFKLKDLMIICTYLVFNAI